jgi:hypothetical protein
MVKSWKQKGLRMLAVVMRDIGVLNCDHRLIIQFISLIVLVLLFELNEYLIIILFSLLLHILVINIDLLVVWLHLRERLLKLIVSLAGALCSEGQFLLFFQILVSVRVGGVVEKSGGG